MADQNVLQEYPLIIRIKDQSGGINQKIFPTEIQDRQAQDLNDFIAEPGIVKKREGYTAFTAQQAAAPVRGLADFKPDNGGTAAVFSAHGVRIDTCDSSGTVSIRATVSNSGLETEFIQAINKVYACNGSDNPLQFNSALTVSTLASAASTPPKFTTGAYFMNRLWTNDTGNKSYLHYSGVLTDSFDRTAQVFKFGEGAGDSEIVKIKPYRSQELIVFMNNRIEELVIVDPTNTTTWVRKVIDSRYGVKAKDSVKEIGGVIYFLDNEGKVRALDRTALDAPVGAAALPISDAIDPIVERINVLYIQKASAGEYKNYYLLAVPLDSATENNAILLYDVTLRSWVGFWDIPAAKFVTTDIRANGREIYFGSSSVARIFRMFNGANSDGGTAIDGNVITKKYDFNRPESDKTFNEIEVHVLATGGGTVDVYARVDLADFTLVGSFDVVSTAPSLPINFPFNLGGVGVVKEKFHLEDFSRGRNIDFKFVHNETDDLQILMWIVTILDENYENENG